VVMPDKTLLPSFVNNVPLVGNVSDVDPDVVRVRLWAGRVMVLFPLPAVEAIMVLNPPLFSVRVVPV
jgi:hypothetical protein